ncbi:MAG: RNA methyltransferase [Proteobacteria bacterium]|nr:RNA methyltransferase [Pseudomonadota bacterium]
MNLLENIFIILLYPKRSGNVGSIARIMKNFSFKNLRVVSKRDILGTFETKKMSVHAYDIIKGGKKYKNLKDAISDLSVVIGTTGKFHKDAPTLIDLDFFDNFLSLSEKNKVGILFGPEDRGLSNEELALCSYTLTIPANPEYPSLNLSHAVGIVLWEIFKRLENERPKKARKVVTKDNMERLYKMMEDVYTEIGFLDKINPARIMKALRSLYDRFEISDRELRILMGILKQTRWYIEHLKKKGA